MQGEQILKQSKAGTQTLRGLCEWQSCLFISSTARISFAASFSSWDLCAHRECTEAERQKQLVKQAARVACIDKARPEGQLIIKTKIACKLQRPSKAAPSVGCYASAYPIQKHTSQARKPAPLGMTDSQGCRVASSRRPSSWQCPHLARPQSAPT